MRVSFAISTLRSTNRFSRSKAVRAGACHLELLYRRPYEPDAPPARTFAFDVWSALGRGGRQPPRLVPHQVAINRIVQRSSARFESVTYW